MPPKKPKAPKKRPYKKRRSKAQQVLDGPAKRGRPSEIVLTPALQKRICDAIRQGSWLEIAAEAAGVSYRRLLFWLRKGTEFIEIDERDQEKVYPRYENRVYADFVAAVRKANAEGELKDVQLLNKYAKTHLDAVKFKLQAKSQYREDSSWAIKQKKEITSIKQDPAQAPGATLDKLNLPLELRIQILDALKKRQQDEESKVLTAPAPPTETPANVLDAEFTVKLTPEEPHGEDLPPATAV